MKKKLIVGGCSFTDKNLVSDTNPEYDCSFPKWPEILAKKLDMDCINLGASGAGNNLIYSTLIDQIIRTPKEEIGFAIASWSQVQRDDWQEYNIYTPKTSSHKDLNYDNMVWRNRRLYRDGNIFYWFIDQLRRYVSFQQLCKSYNIPYKQFQMLSPFDGYLNGLQKTDWEVVQNLDNPDFQGRYDYDSTLETIQLDRNYLTKTLLDHEKYIDTDNFIGWPPLPYVGGFAIEQKVMMYENLETRYDLIISEYDFHPNEQGHQLLAEYIYGQLV